MAARKKLVRVLTHMSHPVIAIGGALVLGGASVGLAWYLTSASFSGTYATVMDGPITQEVDVSSTVKASQNTDLSFQTVGQVAAIRAAVGQHVSAGESLVVLSNQTQTAAVELAQANVKTQQAKLDALLAGTRPEQLAIDQTALVQAQTSLANAIQSAYINADDAVHAKADPAFTNPRVTGAQLIPLVPDKALVDRVQTERIALEPVLGELAQLGTGSGDLEQNAQQTTADLKTVSRS